jgi:hypothetical protein
MKRQFVTEGQKLSPVTADGIASAAHRQMNEPNPNPDATKLSKLLRERLKSWL